MASNRDRGGTWRTALKLLVLEFLQKRYMDANGPLGESFECSGKFANGSKLSPPEMPGEDDKIFLISSLLSFTRQSPGNVPNEKMMRDCHGHR
jgi:hypothetical protein